MNKKNSSILVKFGKEIGVGIKFGDESYPVTDFDMTFEKKFNPKFKIEDFFPISKRVTVPIALRGILRVDYNWLTKEIFNSAKSIDIEENGKVTKHKIYYRNWKIKTFFIEL
jgi:hypothetical protein